jgi:hypothetical protein
VQTRRRLGWQQLGRSAGSSERKRHGGRELNRLRLSGLRRAGDRSRRGALSLRNGLSKAIQQC